MDTWHNRKENMDSFEELTSETPDISGSLETLKLEVVIKIYNRLRIWNSVLINQYMFVTIQELLK